jgi:hypothetical protein
MARPQGPFDWQGRLESQGRVSFGPSRVFSGLLLGVAIVALLGFLVEIARDGPALWSVFGTLVLAACALTTGRAALLGAAELTVTHDGFRLGRGDVVPFDRLTAVAVLRRTMTLRYAASSGEKRLVVSLPRLGAFRPGDLAVWLLKLKGGPSAQVVVDERAGLSRVFRLRDEVPG